MQSQCCNKDIGQYLNFSYREVIRVKFLCNNNNNNNKRCNVSNGPLGLLLCFTVEFSDGW